MDCCRHGYQLKDTVSRGLQAAFAFGRLCPQAAEERGLKPATTLPIPNPTEIHKEFGLARQHEPARRVSLGPRGNEIRVLFAGIACITQSGNDYLAWRFSNQPPAGMFRALQR